MAEQLLVKIEDPKSIFIDNGVDKLLQEIDALVAPLVFDVQTAKGRTECASWAAKVSRSKTFLDGVGKDLVSDWKTKAKAVDVQRKHLRDSLDKIKRNVRAPLTDYEEKQKREWEARQKQIESICLLGNTESEFGHKLSAENLQKKLDLLREIPVPDEYYGEQLAHATQVYQFARNNLEAALIVRREEELKAAEEAERLEEERKAAEEAHIVARIERGKAEAVERERRKKIAAVEYERRKSEYAMKEEQRKAQNAIEDEKRKAQIEAARKQAEIDKKESERLADERKKKEADEQQRRQKWRLERDKNHRAQIHAKIDDCLLKLGMDAITANAVLDALIQNKIPHVRIDYGSSK